MKEILMEDNGFALVAQPGEYWVSWVSHQDCPSSEVALPASAPWRFVNIFDKKCEYCPATVPDGLVTLWKLHNWDNYTKALRIRAKHGGFGRL